ncbi:ATP-grasp fold amidoligase family protein [Enterobacter cloacae]|uniref:ATP-grasp fold amidoligase family protein n=1 Tax=Enterobacter cloacae TaxID=550 RepID=UPI002A448540|nr:glycosyl transferase [Enterobacter cloacae]
MNKTTYYLKHLEYLLRKCRSYLISDINFHLSRLKATHGDTFDIKSPATLNEKICHRLVYDHNSHYTLLADKLAVREYVLSRTQRLNVVPLIGVYRRVEHIDLTKLPNKFVLKCNHDSGSAIICTNKAEFDLKKTQNKLRLALKRNLYYTTREWQYKNILPVILCEQYIDLFNNTDKSTTSEMLRIHCFHGIAQFVEADFTDESGNGFINVYDRHWQLQPFQMEYPNTPQVIPRPASYQEAVLAAQDLAQGIDYCRVDLMLTQDEIYFSEITLSPKRGKLAITPPEWDARLGEMWQMTPVTNRLI